MNNLKSFVCRKANQLVKEGYTKSDSFKEAWKIAKGNAYIEAPSKAENLVTTKEATDLTHKVYQYKELQKKMEELKSQMDTIKGALVAEMEEQNTQEMTVDIFTIHYTPVVSTKFNSKEFKKLYEDLYKQFTFESKYKRFEIV